MRRTAERDGALSGGKQGAYAKPTRARLVIVPQ